MHDIISGATSYGLGILALFFTQDMTTYAALAGLILVCVRILGDLPRAIAAWISLFNIGEDDEDDSND